MVLRCFKSISLELPCVGLFFFVSFQEFTWWVRAATRCDSLPADSLTTNPYWEDPSKRNGAQKVKKFYSYLVSFPG